MSGGVVAIRHGTPVGQLGRDFLDYVLLGQHPPGQAHALDRDVYLGATSSPSGLGAMNSTCSAAWPPARCTVVTSAGRNRDCWASRSLFAALSVGAARPLTAGTADTSNERSGTAGSAPSAGAPKPMMSN